MTSKTVVPTLWTRCVSGFDPVSRTETKPGETCSGGPIGWPGLSAAVVALLAIVVLSRTTDEWARTAFLYYDAGYDDLGYQAETAIWIRLVVMVIGLVGALSVIALVPRARGWFTAMGGATLVVYLFHGFPLKLAEWLGWSDWATSHLLAGFVLTVAGSVAIALTLASPPVRGRLVWAVDPVGSWRTRRLRRRAAAAPEPATDDRPSATPALPGPGPRP